MTVWVTHPVYGNYEVSDQGDVRNRKRKRLRAMKLNDRDGYRRFNASTPEGIITLKVATLVCECFHGPRPFPDAVVRHGELGIACDAANNLSWGTQAENLMDRRRDGTVPRGLTRLSKGAVMAIRERARDGVPKVKIADEFGTSPSNVRFIVARRTWASI